MCGVVLAGGCSSRMGRDKALALLHGKPLIEHVVSAVSAVVSDVYIGANTPEDYAFLGLPVITDRIRNIGPLGGIHAALAECDSDYVLIVACDLPFLSKDLLKLVCCEIGQDDIVAFESPTGIEPLCAVYSGNCLPAINASIAAKQYAVIDLYRKVKTRTISYHDFDLPPAAFLNINTPQDLIDAESAPDA